MAISKVKQTYLAYHDNAEREIRCVHGGVGESMFEGYARTRDETRPAMLNSLRTQSEYVDALLEILFLAKRQAGKLSINDDGVLVFEDTTALEQYNQALEGLVVLENAMTEAEIVAAKHGENQSVFLQE